MRESGDLASLEDGTLAGMSAIMCECAYLHIMASTLDRCRYSFAFLHFFFHAWLHSNILYMVAGYVNRMLLECVGALSCLMWKRPCVWFAYWTCILLLWFDLHISGTFVSKLGSLVLLFGSLRSPTGRGEGYDQGMASHGTNYWTTVYL